MVRVDSGSWFEYEKVLWPQSVTHQGELRQLGLSRDAMVRGPGFAVEARKIASLFLFTSLYELQA